MSKQVEGKNSLVSMFAKRYEQMNKLGGFSDPSEMIYLLQKYFEWIEENPLYKGKSGLNRGEVVKWTVKKHRAPSITGFALFCGMSSIGLMAYAQKPEYAEACCIVQDCINESRFVLASSDMINGIFIGKILQGENRLSKSDDNGISLEEAGQQATNKLNQYINGIAGNEITIESE